MPFVGCKKIEDHLPPPRTLAALVRLSVERECDFLVRVVFRLCRLSNAETLMAFAAHYAPAGAREHHGPSPWLAALLTVLTPGLGHLYIGQARRGITLFVLVMIADTLLMFAMMGVLARFWMFATSFMLLVGLWLYILFDAIRRARRTPPLPDHGHSGWATYVAA